MIVCVDQVITDIMSVLCCAVSADQWNAQATVMRINESLIERGYVTWFDLTNMKGITSALAAASDVTALVKICSFASLYVADRP
jgi:hypothetical protein